MTTYGTRTSEKNFPPNNQQMKLIYFYLILAILNESKTMLLKKN